MELRSQVSDQTRARRLIFGNRSVPRGVWLCASSADFGNASLCSFFGLAALEVSQSVKAMGHRNVIFEQEKMFKADRATSYGGHKWVAFGRLPEHTVHEQLLLFPGCPGSDAQHLQSTPESNPGFAEVPADLKASNATESASVSGEWCIFTLRDFKT